MSIDGVNGSNGVNAQTNTSGFGETKAPNEESGDKSIFDLKVKMEGPHPERDTTGTMEGLPENLPDNILSDVSHDLEEKAIEKISEKIEDLPLLKDIAGIDPDELIENSIFRPLKQEND